ncbi:MAG: ABC transporter permease [Anaerolineales bacterium]|nr:MAG: ABC transporter permease [Anaerolineales bacterium]
MMYRMWTLILKELIHLARNPALVFLVTLGPLSEMSMVAWSTAAPIEHLPTAVVDLDRSQESRALLAALHNTETFDFRHYLDSVDETKPLVEQGRVVGALIIPAGYGDKVSTPLGETPALSFTLDGSDPVAAQAALAAVEGTVLSQSQKILAEWVGGHPLAMSLIQPRLRVRFNEELKKSVYTVPSELGLILFAIGLMLASMSIARERELGTLEQLAVTPIRRFELIVAKAIPAVLLSYVSFIMMLLVAMIAFDVPMRGSWLLLLGSSTIFLFVELSIGLMISAVSSNQLQALLAAFMWVMVEFLFSGYGVPVENMPLILQKTANIFPIYHYMIIFRAILLKGVGFDTVWPQMLAGLVIGAVVIPTAVWFLGRQKWE